MNATKRDYLYAVLANPNNLVTKVPLHHVSVWVGGLFVAAHGEKEFGGPMQSSLGESFVMAMWYNEAV